MKSFLVVVVFGFCWFLTESASHRFQAESQREVNVWSYSKPAAGAAVNFTVYMEFLCPACKDGFNTQLSPTFKKVGSIMNLDLVPYGNCDEGHEGGKWTFKCQHGPMECLGNLIETCAIYIFGGVSGAFPYIDCLEKSEQMPNVSAPQCAQQLGIDYGVISECVNGPLGNKLQHQMAVKTREVYPPLDHVPWVLLNGEHTDEIDKRASTDLLGLICDTYTGIKPEACKKDTAD